MQLSGRGYCLIAGIAVCLPAVKKKGFLAPLTKTNYMHEKATPFHYVRLRIKKRCLTGQLFYFSYK